MWCIVGASFATSGEVLEESCGRRSVGSPMTKLPKFRFSVDFFQDPRNPKNLLMTCMQRGEGGCLVLGEGITIVFTEDQVSMYFYV